MRLALQSKAKLMSMCIFLLAPPFSTAKTIKIMMLGRKQEEEELVLLSIFWQTVYILLVKCSGVNKDGSLVLNYETFIICNCNSKMTEYENQTK